MAEHPPTHDSQPPPNPESPPTEISQPRPKNKGRIIWTPEEEITLTRAWIHITEDRRLGNSKKREHFWQRALDYFDKSLGKPNYRTTDQLCSKWRDLKIKVTKFNGMVDHLRSKQRNEADILTQAHNQYRLETGHPFAHIHVWEIVHDHPIWTGVPLMNPSPKKSKISESESNTPPSHANAPIELNGDNNGHREPQGPSGGRKSKTSASSTPRLSRDDSKNASQVTKLVETLRSFQQFQEMQEERKERYRQEKIKLQYEKQKLQYEKQRTKDMEILMQPTAHLTGRDLELVLKFKDDIRKKYDC